MGSGRGDEKGGFWVGLRCYDEFVNGGCETVTFTKIEGGRKEGEKNATMLNGFKLNKNPTLSLIHTYTSNECY